MKLTVHTVVKNEDLWIWYALQSVLAVADSILIFDTGSTDRTVEIIKSIKSDKIIFEEKGAVDKIGLTKLRQEQLERTTTDWLLILDGDEVWREDQLSQLLKEAEHASASKIAVFNRVRNCVGDVYHYLSDEVGDYRIAGKKGNLNIRLIKKTTNLKVTGEYPLEHYSDQNGPIQDQKDNLIYSAAWYLHTSFLSRSSQDKSKTSGSFGRAKVPQRGIYMAKKQLPEVLSLERPLILTNPLKKRGLWYQTVSLITHPALMIKRKIQ